jgi:hypothetical protein
MKQSIHLNKNIARQRGEAGLLQAIASAESVFPDWAERAYLAFKKWLSRKPSGYRFQMENFRLYVDIHKPIPKPNTDRAYGGIPVRAKNEGLIKSLGPKSTSSLSSHSCFAMEWKKI